MTDETEMKQAIKANLQLLSKEQLIDKLADIIVALTFFQCCTDYTQQEILKSANYFSNTQTIKNNNNEKGT